MMFGISTNKTEWVLNFIAKILFFFFQRKSDIFLIS